MNFNDKYSQYQQAFENCMDQIFNKYVCNCIPVKAAMAYSVNAGGKRIRPVIMCAVAEALGMDISFIAPYGAALEFIHTYSLIHDDLPAMDNDDFRRGKPTNHKVYGEAMAILAGDGLLNLAFEVMSDYAVVNSFSDNGVNHIKAMRYISKSAGARGMIGGQAHDVLSEGKKIDIYKLQVIHLMKTAELLKAAVVVPAIIAGKDTDYIKALEKLGNNIGLAFQIKDDILDVEGDKEKVGKTIGKDAQANKNTYVSLLGLEKSKEMLKTVCDNSRKILKELELDNEFMSELITFFEEREK